MGYSFAVSSICLLNKRAGFDQRITVLFVIRQDPSLPTTLEMGAINYEEVDMNNYKNEISIKYGNWQRE